VQLFPDVDGLLGRLERCVIANDDLVRFRDDGGDAEVASIIRSIGTLDVGARSALRSRVSPDAAATLHLFAKRRVVKARKQTSLELVHDAIAAWSLLPVVGDVPWRSWLRAALVIAAPLGEDPHEVVDLFGGSDTAGGVRSQAVVDAVDRTNDLSES
jgi:hypothetical protein